MLHITYLNGIIGSFLFWAFIRYVYDQHYTPGKFTSKTGEHFWKGVLFLRSYTRISSWEVFTSLMNYLNIVLCLYILDARNSTVNKNFHLHGSYILVAETNESLCNQLSAMN